MRRWDELSQSLGEASAPAEVTGALISALATAFPRACLIVALEAEDQPGPHDRGRPARATDGPARRAATTRSCSSSRGCPTTRAAWWRHATAAAVRDVAPGMDDALAAQVGSLYALPLLTPRGPADRLGHAAAAGRAAARAGPTRRSSRRRPTTPAARSRGPGATSRSTTSRSRSSAACCPRRCRRSRASTSPAATAPAASGSRSAATGTTRCAGRTGSSTSPSATWPGAASPPPC